MTQAAEDTPVSTDPLSPTEELLVACDEALEESKKANEAKAELIEAQKAAIDTQGQEITRLREDQGGILKSPITWFLLGVASILLGQAIAN